MPATQLSLPPPPPDSKAPPPWTRWIQQLWDTVRGNSNLDPSLGTVANTSGTQTLTNKTITNLKDDTRAYARAQKDSAQNFPSGSTTVVAFNSTIVDSRSAITGSGTTSWRYTVPTGMGGMYFVGAHVGMNAVAGAGFVSLSLFRNGTDWNCSLGVSPVTAAALWVGGSILVQLSAGDYIDIRVFQNCGTDRAISTTIQDNHVSIIRLVTDL